MFHWEATFLFQKRPNYIPTVLFLPAAQYNSSLTCGDCAALLEQLGVRALLKWLLQILSVLIQIIFSMCNQFVRIFRKRIIWKLEIVLWSATAGLFFIRQVNY